MTTHKTPLSAYSLSLVSAASFGWAISFGLSASLASLYLKDAGRSGGQIGLNTSLYYLGVALMSPLVPLLMSRANRGCVVLGMILDAGTTAAFPLASHLWGWHLLRLIGGAGTALSLIPMETLVNRQAPADGRARQFAFYAFCVAAGIGLGSVLGIALYPYSPRFAFALGGLLTLLAVPLAWFAVPSRSDEVGPEKDHGSFSWSCQLLPLGSAWVQGFLEGGTLAFLSLYLLSSGLTEGAVSVLMGILFTGVVLAQIPFACAADRFGRLQILLACQVLLAAGLALVPVTRSLVPLAIELFVLGACCGALYPLGLALLGDRVPAKALAKANAWYLAGNCAGSLSGPIVIGALVDVLGLRVQFAVGLGAILVLWCVCSASAGVTAKRKSSEFSV